MKKYDIAFDGGIVIKAKNKLEALNKLRAILLRNNINLHDYSMEYDS